MKPWRGESGVNAGLPAKLGGGDAEGLRQPNGGGADRRLRAPECCDVRICPA
jgi:hypothetical protein